MPENEGDGKEKSTSIHAGGDVIGVNMNGDSNIIGKNISVSQRSTSINEITINPHILSKIDEQYANAFKQITESLNNQIKQSRNVKPELVANIQNSLDRLNTIEEPYRQSIRKFTQLSQCKYEIEPFTKAEIEQFIEYSGKFLILLPIPQL
jgi:DNA repair ATPase RecN